jgi:feruloyl esterase
MHRNALLSVLVVLAIGVIALGGTPAANDLCSSLMNNAALHSLKNTTVTSATTVSDTFTPPDSARSMQGLPSFCRVTATLKPSPASDIKIEVWMPSESWNGKLQGVGNGGLAGTITYNALGTAIQKGYASVSTDTGHVVTDTTWMQDAEKAKDYGYRGIHEMTVAAKSVVQQFYGSPAKHSYFSGCSTGGGQAFGETQLYPEDYDGIVAGDPQNYPTNLRAGDIHEFQAGNNDPASNLPRATLSVITAAVLKECGRPGDAEDGFLNDPRSCHFDPEKLLCKSGQATSACLTAAQIAAVKSVYEGTFSMRTMERIWPGLLPGSEAPAGTGWQTVGISGPKPFAAAAQVYSFGVLGNPEPDFHKLDIDAALEADTRKFASFNHISTDIDPFLRRGGKLLIYHGWNDPSVSPLNTIDYYGSLIATIKRKTHLDEAAALKETQKSVRVFMVPGMGHCSGGPGPDSFDALGKLEDWVEQGKAPERINASHLTNGAPVSSRPLCPYPQEAQFTGSGERKDASNWVCADRPFVFDPSFYKVGGLARGGPQQIARIYATSPTGKSQKLNR